MAATAKKISKRGATRARKREQQNAFPPKATGAVQADTPIEEAERRAAAGQDAPTGTDVQRAGKDAVKAQGTADTALLMGPNSDTSDSEKNAPTQDEFRAARASQNDPARVAGVTGRSIHDIQAEQNNQVSELTSTNPPKHIVRQRKEAAQRIADHPEEGAQLRRGRLPKEGAAMTLHQMGQSKVYGTRSA